MKANIEQATGVSSFNSSVGALFLSKTTGRYLFVLRNGSRYDSTWAFVGGKVEKDETEYNALQREIVEEIGFMPLVIKTIPVEKFTNSKNNFSYSTYVCVVNDEFLPKLNDEHNGFAWTTFGNWPKSLHQGLRNTLQNKTNLAKLETVFQVIDLLEE